MGARTSIVHGTEPRGSGLFTLEGCRSAEGRSREGRFGLMFKLPPFAPPDALFAGLAEQMARPVPDEVDSDTPAGYTILGQFITHDLTFDTTPLAVQDADPHAVENFRSPRLDLDSVYAASPVTMEAPPRDEQDPDKLAIARSTGPARPDDLPRRADGTARIGDPRNDMNLLICQLHLAFLKLHNVFVDRVRDESVPAAKVFAEAQRRCRWHVQWVVVNDFLPRVIGQAMVDQVLVRRPGQRPTVDLKFYRPQHPSRPMMPLEFSAAAFRFGHSMIRPSYVVNVNGSGAFIFGERPSSFNLNGSRPIPSRRLEVDWRRFFDAPAPAGLARNRARKIDVHLSPVLATLPRSALPPGEPDPVIAALALRDLLRGKRHGLPSGQRVAATIRDVLGQGEVLSNAALGLDDDPGWDGQAPLWFYILKEAALQANGQRLGAVGGRIVAEVVLGSLALDPHSYLSVDPTFNPSPGSGRFTMADLLHLAGVV